jgi:hypothetical protein
MKKKRRSVYYNLKRKVNLLIPVKRHNHKNHNLLIVITLKLLASHANPSKTNTKQFCDFLPLFLQNSFSTKFSSFFTKSSNTFVSKKKLNEK